MKKKLLLGFITLFIIVFGFFCFWRYQDRDYTITLQKQVDSDKAVPNNVRIATYNIKSLDNGTGLEAFKNDVKGLDLDIIALQEVDHFASRSNSMDMVKEMANVGGYKYYYFYKSMWLLDGDYGLGILSKYPILEVTSDELPNGTLSEPRILASAKIDVNGEILNVYNTHLNYFNRGIRQSQIDFIRDKIENKENTVLMGDMNNFEDKDFFPIDGMHALNNKDSKYITFRDHGIMDNIYYATNLNLVEADVRKTTFSDHNLFWCTIELRSE